jgi:hypothetical protein
MTKSKPSSWTTYISDKKNKDSPLLNEGRLILAGLLTGRNFDIDSIDPRPTPTQNKLESFNSSLTFYWP